MTEPESGATPPEKPVEKPADQAAEKPAVSEKPAEQAAEKPAAATEQPAAAAPAAEKPVAAPAAPAPEKPAAAPAADKPAAAPAAEKPAAAPAAAAPAADKPAAATAAAGDKPVAKPAAAAHAAPAKPAEPPKPLEPGYFGQFLKEHGINSEREADHSRGVECIVVAAKDIETVLKRLRNSPETQLNYLITITGVEQAEHFESVYHLWSYTNLKELVVKVKIQKSSVAEGALPVVPSIANFWGAANWHERETYDLVGIRYSGHPYLRRILNPWDWAGHPLRRDYKQPVDALNDKNPDSFR